MSSEHSRSSPAHSTPPRQSLEPQLTRQFELLIARHPTLNIDQICYLETSRLYLQLVQKQEQVQVLQNQVRHLRKQLGLQVSERKKPSLIHSNPPDSGALSQRRKRTRRTAVEIARHYNCNIDKCNKSYGSQGSLNQHIKLKHKSHYSKHMLMMDFNHSH